MNKSKLQEMIREIIQKVLAEGPATAPSKPKPSPGPAVAPGKPGTGKPKPRRPLGNPDVKPNPKAEGLNEEEILKKIVARFKSKNMNENAEQKYSYVKTHKNTDKGIVNVLGAYPDPKGTFTKEKISNIPSGKSDKWEIKFYKNKQEAESAIKSKK